MPNEYTAVLTKLASAFSRCDDFCARTLPLSGGEATLFCLKGAVSREFISESVIKPLLSRPACDLISSPGGCLGAAAFETVKGCEAAVASVASGELLIAARDNGEGCAIISVSAQSAPSRAVSEPSSDVTVRGPKAGFVEDCGTNLALLRRCIRSSGLKSIPFKLGDISQTKLLLCFVEGRASERFVNELCGRLSSLKASVISDSANVAMLLEGGREPLLPACGTTEKVDKAAAKLMAGRVAVIVDGSPFVLTMPFVFAESIQSSDDYLHTPYYATFIRVLRLAAFLASVFAPGVLCALVTHENAFLPQSLYGLINKSREGVPESFFLEILTVLLLFELLREVGVRMPRPVGDAVGIVGSIILGNTAVDAGIVSSVGVITVAFAAVCAFITPAYMYVIVLFRIAVLVLAQIFGVCGVGLSAAILITLLSTRKSFGVPYLFPLSPHDPAGMQDFVFAWPKKTLGRRERLGKKR